MQIDFVKRPLLQSEIEHLYIYFEALLSVNGSVCGRGCAIVCEWSWSRVSLKGVQALLNILIGGGALHCHFKRPFCSYSMRQPPVLFQLSHSSFGRHASHDYCLYPDCILIPVVDLRSLVMNINGPSKMQLGLAMEHFGAWLCSLASKWERFVHPIKTVSSIQDLLQTSSYERKQTKLCFLW